MPPDLIREWRRFVSAAQLLTRVPMPTVAFDSDWLRHSAKYFPLVGILIGGAAAAVLLAAARFWPAPLPAVLAVGAALLLTGALHEDGLADAADSVGGATREHRLAIMKDSRLGTYGALALALVLALQVAALAAMPPRLAAATLVCAHAAGRAAPVLLMATTPYAGAMTDAKLDRSGGRVPSLDAALAVVFGLAPALCLADPLAGLSALALGAGAAAFASYRLCGKLGGHTGDVLGAACVVAQTGILLGLAVRP